MIENTVEFAALTEGEMEDIAQSMGRLEGKVDAAEKERNRISLALFGNGSGREGLLTRMANVETKMDNLMEAVKSGNEDTSDIKDSIETMRDSITELTDLVKEHVQDDDKHTFTGLIRSMPAKTIIGLAAVAVILWLLIATIVPEGVVLWDLIAHWLGF